jgi:hypothetical protein
MKPEQMRKFVGWCGFYVALPLVVYPAAVVIAKITDVAYSFQDIFVKGDLLFVVVVLLATTVDWTVIDFRLTPITKSTKQWLDYVIFVVALLALLFYTLMYGWLITTRLPESQPIRNAETLAHFSGWSLLFWTLFCGSQYFHLLRQGRL